MLPNPHAQYALPSGLYTPPVLDRSPPTETAESRRRVSRGRAGGHRSAYLSTRPNSISSPRLYPPTSQALQAQPSPLSFFTSATTDSDDGASIQRPRDAVQTARGTVTNNTSAPPTHTRHHSNLEGASPAIAVGSTASIGDRQSASLATASSSTNSTTSNTAGLSPPAPPFSQNRPIAFGSMRGSPTFFDALGQQENSGPFYDHQSQHGYAGDF